MVSIFGWETWVLNKVKGLSYIPETELLGKTDVTDDKWETELTVMKKTKPKHVYVLKNTSFSTSSLEGYGNVASLKEKK